MQQTTLSLASRDPKQRYAESNGAESCALVTVELYLVTVNFLFFLNKPSIAVAGYEPLQRFPGRMGIHPSIFPLVELRSFCRSDSVLTLN